MHEYAKELLEDTREELVRADGKASLLLAAAGVAVGALLAGLLSGDWSPFDLDNRIEWLWWLSIAVYAWALFQLASAVFPRTTRIGSAPSVVAYYGDVVAYAKRPIADLKKALDDSANSPDDRLADQLREISRIVAEKYKSIRYGMLSLLVAVTLCVLSVVVNSFMD